MNKKTTALTTEQYREIIIAMREGSSYFRPNERVATALVLEGNLGLRISDIDKPCRSYAHSAAWADIFSAAGWLRDRWGGSAVCSRSRDLKS